MATLIRSNGDIVEVFPEDGKEFNLEEMQLYVGGYIEIVLTRDNKHMIIDEEGKIKNKRYNDKATALYKHGNHDQIVGDALLCEHGEVS